MPTDTAPSVLGIERSLSGKKWRWRGGNMDLSRGGTATVAHDIVTQLLLARGVAEADLTRNRTPTLRDFLPSRTACSKATAPRARRW